MLKIALKMNQSGNLQDLKLEVIGEPGGGCLSRTEDIIALNPLAAITLNSEYYEGVPDEQVEQFDYSLSG